MGFIRSISYGVIAFPAHDCGLRTAVLLSSHHATPDRCNIHLLVQYAICIAEAWGKLRG